MMTDDFYIYVFRDPRKDNEPFYVGKGRQKRYQQHFTRDGFGHEVSSETRQKISAAITGNKYGPLSDDHRRKVSEALRGIPKTPFSLEHRKRLGQASKGRAATDTARENMRNAQIKRRQKELKK